MMEDINLKNLLEVAKSAANKASVEIMTIYDSDSFDISSKSDNSPLTKADKAGHDEIVKTLASTNIPILSEEGSEIDITERGNWEYYWLIDPLDGTKEFIKRNGEFTVNIALVHDHFPILGVVYTPVTREMYYGVQNEGAFVQRNGEPEKLICNEFHMSDERLSIVASRSHLNSDTESFISALSNPQIVSKGSSLKFLMVASGEADLYPRYAPTMEWDTGAAQIIVEEAGGSVNQMNGERLAYNKKNLLNPYFLVSGKVRS